MGWKLATKINKVFGRGYKIPLGWDKLIIFTFITNIETYIMKDANNHTKLTLA